jgi:hypothetical protein
MSVNLFNSPIKNSPDAQLIYNQYITYYTQANAMINAIDQLDPNKRTQPSVLADRATIISSQAQIAPIWQQDYVNPNATLASFQNDCAPMISAINAAYQDAMGGGSPIHAKIAQDSTAAQTLAGSLTASLSNDQTTLNSAPALQTTINGLQAQINALPPGPSKDKAQADLVTAQTNLNQLVAAVTAATPSFASVQASVNGITTPTTGVLAQLQQLAALTNPTQANLTQADQLLTVVQSAQGALQTFEGSSMAAVSAALATANAAIAAVQKDVQPTPVPGKIEHSCWYIDWTSWSFPIPQGVNTVNLFVGEIVLVNGQPTIGGFGNMQLAALDDFVTRCQNNQPPIAVKVSIGGGGGSYDNCWDLIKTPADAASFAQGMVDFCHTHKLAGVDFDYEEFASAEQETLVGTLIKNFKTLDPTLQATLCTNAGLGWETAIKNILDATMSGTSGKSPLDRLYIMSYYDALDQEEQWISSWATWAKQNYGLDPSQITVGLDDFDAHAYDIGVFSKWAAQQGFSTAYWAWNPATQAQSDASSLKILNSYQASSLSLPARLLVWLLFWLSPILSMMLEKALTPERAVPKTTTLLGAPKKRHKLVSPEKYPPPPYEAGNAAGEPPSIYARAGIVEPSAP